MNNLKGIFVGLLLGGALTTIGFQQRDITNLRQQAAQQRLGAALASQVLMHDDFVKSLSVKDALMWTQFLQEAVDMPDASSLAEYKESPTSRTIPIGVHFQRGNEAWFTVVVGTRTLYGDPKIGQSVVNPTLAYYASGRRSALTRFSRFDATPEISLGLQDWRTSNIGDYSLFREYLEKDLRAHLRGEE